MSGAVVIAVSLGGVSPLEAERIDLMVSAYKHITFKGIKPTHYYNLRDRLLARVENSASALLYAFDKVRPVRRISFRWKLRGRLRVRSKQHEKSKAGDDAYFRIGLMLHGKAPAVPFFAPAWIKMTQRHMRLPAAKITYVAISSRHGYGESWLSPYDRSIRIVAINRRVAADRFTQVTYQFDRTLQVVGLWLMADGDDTGSRFSVSIKDLVLEAPSQH